MTITEFKIFWRHKEEYFYVYQDGNHHFFVRCFPLTLVYSRKEIMKLTEQDLEGHYYDCLLKVAFT